MDDDRPVPASEAPDAAVPAPEAPVSEGSAPAAPVSEVSVAEAPASEAPASEASDPESDPDPESADEDEHGNGLAKGSIAAAGERLGQRVAQVGEAAGDRVTHAGEAAGQRVILAGEAAEGTIADAQTRAAQAKQRIAAQAGELAERIRHTTPAAVRERGARVVEAVRKHRRGALAGSAVVGIAAAKRRRGKRSGDGEP